MCNITSANILTGYKTDHSLIEIMAATPLEYERPWFLETQHFAPNRNGLYKPNTDSN